MTELGRRGGSRVVSLPTAAILLLWGAVCVGCQGPSAPANLPRLFQQDAFDPSAAGAYAVDPTSKYAGFAAEVAQCRVDLPPMDQSDYAMLAANSAMLEEALGNLDQAFEAAMASQRVMTGDVKGEGGRALAATLGDEGSKVFKGESFEIAMLNCYVGLYSLRMGDPETAAIGFRRAIEADKMSKEKYRNDLNLAYWGLGMASLDSDPDTARIAFQQIGAKPPETVAQENMVFLIAMGRAPSKRLVGLYGEYDTFDREPYEPRSAEVYVDGRSLGRSVGLVDLYEQSQGVPRSAKDAGQGAKAVGKFALAAVAGAFLGSAGQDLVESGWSVKADTRTCYMLPNEIHVVSARLTPGAHTVQVKFYDVAGQLLPRYEQVWHYVSAPSSGRAYMAIRSEPDRCNVQGPIAFTRVNKVKAKADAPVVVRFRAANLPAAKVGDTVRVCHFYEMTENRWDMQYHWRYAPMAYNRKGEPTGYPGARLRMQDFDIGLIGLAKIIEIDGDTGLAEMVSLTTEYTPQVDDMVTACKRDGRLWR